MNTFTRHISSMLNIGHDLFRREPHLTEEIGTVNAKGDKSIQMDVAIEKALITYVKEQKLPATIFSEEIGTVTFHPNPTHLIAFDPLDGSTNYKVGKGLFPYGLLVAIYEGLEPKLADVVAAGAIEYTRNLTWTYSEGKTYDTRGNRVTLRVDWPILKSTPIYVDLYYKEGYETYRPLAQQLFIRNQGSTVGNLSYVLSNTAAAIGGVSMRPEEIGAVVALIKGAGGIAVNHQGDDVGTEVFSPEKTYQILGGPKHIVGFMVDTVKK